MLTLNAALEQRVLSFSLLQEILPLLGLTEERESIVVLSLLEVLRRVQGVQLVRKSSPVGAQGLTDRSRVMDACCLCLAVEGRSRLHPLQQHHLSPEPLLLFLDLNVSHAIVLYLDRFVKQSA